MHRLVAFDKFEFQRNRGFRHKSSDVADIVTVKCDRESMQDLKKQQN